jgi:hypothetical protein
MARPLIEIDPEEVKKLAQLGCKTEEIADFLKVSVDTIDRRFAEELAKGRADLKMSLRRMQIQAAQRGNVAMMIWLGKQLLGQIDRAQIDISKIPDEEFMEEAKRRIEDERNRRIAETASAPRLLESETGKLK